MRDAWQTPVHPLTPCVHTCPFSTPLSWYMSPRGFPCSSFSCTAGPINCTSLAPWLTYVISTHAAKARYSCGAQSPYTSALMLQLPKLSSGRYFVDLCSHLLLGMSSSSEGTEGITNCIICSQHPCTLLRFQAQHPFPPTNTHTPSAHPPVGQKAGKLAFPFMHTEAESRVSTSHKLTNRRQLRFGAIARGAEVEIAKRVPLSGSRVPSEVSSRAHMMACSCAAAIGIGTDVNDISGAFEV